jgi:hypothetical protein
MHKGVILITQASDKYEALTQVRQFMDGYENDVWDWYAIGGRWHNLLAPAELLAKFEEESKPIILSHERNPDPNFERISQNAVDLSDAELQVVWDRLGLKGKHRYSNHHALPEDGGEYDVIPLAEAMPIVSEWTQDHIESGKGLEERAKEWKDKGDFRMYGYALKVAGQVYGQYFSFKTNVFNINSDDFTVPTDPTGYFAVTVDMHN